MGTKKIAGPGKLGSIKAAKQSVKSKGNANVRTIPAEDSLTVRFLEEPSEWYGFYQHYDKAGGKGYIPCTEDDCEGCESPNDETRRKQFRYLANAYVVDDQKVRAVLLPKTLVEQLLGYYDKKSTLLDRDYDLSRTGTGQFDTNYLAAPDSPSKMKLDRFKPLDLAQVLADMLDGGVSDDDDDEEDEDTPPRRKKGKPATKKKRKVADDDDDPWEDDDEDEDDDDDEDEPPRRRVAKKSSVKKSTRPASKTSKKSTRTRSVKRSR